MERSFYGVLPFLDKVLKTVFGQNEFSLHHRDRGSTLVSKSRSYRNISAYGNLRQNQVSGGEKWQ